MSKTGYHIKNYFTISRSQRNAFLVLFVILILMIALYFLLPRFIQPREYDFQSYAEKTEAFEKTRIEQQKKENELTPFYFDPNTLDSSGWLRLGLSPYQAGMILKYRRAGGTFYDKPDLEKIYAISEDEYTVLAPYINIKVKTPARKKTMEKPDPFPFDPNTATKTELVKLGLNEGQAGNILKYREAGGRFNIKKDLAKIYSIDQEDYTRLEKYILLPHADTSMAKSGETEKTAVSIEINSADTSELQKLYGIGPAFAGRIVKYRELLGGFFDKSQLLEVYGMDTVRFAGFSEQVKIDTVLISRKNLNTVEFKELLRHPYLEFYMVKSIFDYKDANGGFDSVAELKNVEMIYDELYRKIAPYLVVNKNNNLP